MIALRSLAHSHKQHPPLCVFYTHSLPNKTPLSSRAQPRGWKSPRGDFTKTPTPGQHPAVGHTRTHPYRIYRAPVRLWRGCSQSRAFVFVSCLRLSLALGLVSVSSLSLVVCLGDDNASSVVRRNNDRARASASFDSSLSLSSCVSPLSSQARERARAPSFRLAVCHPITGPDQRYPRIAKRRLN